MSARKNAAKHVDKEFRALGATRMSTRYGTDYTFPDGATRFVPSNIGFTAAHILIRETERRYVKPRSAALAGVPVRRRHAPRIDLTKTAARWHAKERLALMREQAGVTELEITTALTAPCRVLWSERYGTWMFEGDRIAVVVAVDDDGNALIHTLLWTTPELLAAHPRPEMEPR